MCGVLILYVEILYFYRYKVVNQSMFMYSRVIILLSFRELSFRPLGGARNSWGRLRTRLRTFGNLDGEGHEDLFCMGRVMKFHAAWIGLQNTRFSQVTQENFGATRHFYHISALFTPD